MITPKWILDSVCTIVRTDCSTFTTTAARNTIADHLAPELLQRLPQDAMRSLAEVACARSALDSSDTQQCAADLVKSIVEVLAAGDTEVMSLTAQVGEAWGTLSQLGVPLGDEGSVFSLVDRIKWLDSNRRDAWHERDRADDRAADLERNDANRALAERDRISGELAAAIKANRHLREENQRLIAQIANSEAQVTELTAANADLATSLERSMCTIADLELEVDDEEADARASALIGDPQ